MIEIPTVVQSLLPDRRPLPKSREDSVARSKASYEKDIETSCTLKRQRYVMLCACMFAL